MVVVDQTVGLRKSLSQACQVTFGQSALGVPTPLKQNKSYKQSSSSTAEPKPKDLEFSA